MRKLVVWSVIFVMAVALPLVGVVVAGKSAAAYLEFPPVTGRVEPAGFAWSVFIIMAVGILAVVAPFEWRMFKRRRQLIARPSAHEDKSRRFPWWGWLGIVAGIIFWVLAWSRFEWFSSLQQFTFSPLWFAYIVVVNAWTYKRTGACMMTSRPRMFAALFLLSAVFWWYFEYLNRFVQNWYYVNIGDLSAWEYFLFATLPFSTVLPAVLGTYELLKSSEKAGAGLNDFTPIDFSASLSRNCYKKQENNVLLTTRSPSPSGRGLGVRVGEAISEKGRLAGFLALAVAGAGLAGIGVWPNYLFPLLWVSPLLIVTGVQAVAGDSTIFSSVRHGRWRNLYLLALAALICGGFWEMWNFFSLAQWKYSVPYVQAFLLFEMPLLGYAGYLPFGIECAVVARIAGFTLLENNKEECEA